MTGARRTLLVLGVLGLLAAGSWLVAAPGRPAASPAAAPAPAPAGSISPLPAARASTVPPAAPATPAPTAPASRARKPVEPVAEPFVQNYAGQPGVKPLKRLPSPTTTHYVRPNVDGCDHNYGEITQCVPWTFPAGTDDKCAWLTARGFKALKVVAADRQKLDRDGNGIACDD